MSAFQRLWLCVAPGLEVTNITVVYDVEHKGPNRHADSETCHGKVTVRAVTMLSGAALADDDVAFVGGFCTGCGQGHAASRDSG